MNKLFKIVSKALSAVIITGGGAFAQEIEESMNPLRNSRNYKSKATVRQEWKGNPYGSEITKEVSKNYKRPNRKGKSLVVALTTSPASKRNYKRPYSQK
ncbi:hypothetical protein [Jiulongibacter sediminis]|jgi:hypothetical protein|uniref:hypothetical protein n=1 Tax=Jiulongibacter sediminis TaxID=1605367 RepID=UPI0026EC4A56|nr:hypothetical protein [Jiulongibacter sediminis]